MSASMPTAILRQAAEWLVRMDNRPDAECQRAFQAWLAAAPEHAAAVARLQGHLAPLQALPAQAARNALRRTGRKPRTRALQALALAACLIPSALMGIKQWQQGYLLADLSTSSAEWLDRPLADGSQIHLDGDSAVDVHMDGAQRRIRLLRGEILVDVAKDKRPFYVDTPQGSVRALGTRFTVERQEDSTLVTMLESITLIESSGKSLQLRAGQRVRLGTAGPGEIERVDAQAQESAWGKHQLLAQDQPLSDVLERLARHRRGLLLFDRAALADMRVTVVLPIDDSPRALRLLERTLPIQVTHFTPWVTRISLKPQQAQK